MPTFGALVRYLQKALAYHQLGCCYLAAQSYEEATGSYRAGLALARQLKRNDLIALFYDALAQAYYPQAFRQDSVVKYGLLLESGYIYYLHDVEAHSRNLTNLAGAFYNLRDYEKAKYYWLQEIRYGQINPDLQNTRSRSWNNLAGAYHKTGQADSELYCLQQGIASLTEDQKRPASVLYLSLGEYYRDQQQIPEALQSLHTAGELLAADSQDLQLQTSLLELYALTYGAQKRYDSALVYALRYA